MLIYDTYDEANQAEGTQIRPRGTSGSSTIRESDWAYRLRGYGQPGGLAGSWLLCFQFPRTDRSADGTLVAYELSHDNERTGRVGIVRRNWTQEADQQWFKQIRTRISGDWQSTNMQPGGEADLEEIDELLPGQKL